ncbi:MAG: ribonuclease HII [Ruminococcus sp.]|nr:ribonuclease HII [Ruminococcus sp.]MBQ8906159.1 ribonuclease HII [Ruminococcus sp.]
MARQLIVRQALFDYDADIRRRYPVFCGVDEAGRGPLAGDVYAAAVVLPPDIVIPGLDDSKKIPEKRRELLYEEICRVAVSYSIACATIEEIEEMNILAAAMLAMNRAVSGLSCTPNCALIDGNRAPQMNLPMQLVVKGDATSASIAAASVLAKVARDRYMAQLDQQYPMYGFSKHKGYGTKAHYDAIREYGISPVHRPSFLKKLQ